MRAFDSPAAAGFFPEFPRRAQFRHGRLAERESLGDQIAHRNRGLRQADSRVLRGLSHDVVKFMREQTPQRASVQELRIGSGIECRRQKPLQRSATQLDEREDASIFDGRRGQRLARRRTLPRFGCAVAFGVPVARGAVAQASTMTSAQRAERRMSSASAGLCEGGNPSHG